MKELLLDVVEDVEFYQDILNDEALFAEFTMGSGVRCFDRLESLRFKAFLRMKALELTNDKEELNAENAVGYIRDRLIYEESANKVDVYIRTAGNLEEGIEYSLKDKKQRTVVIDKEGWEIATETKYKFLRSSASRAQAVPKRCEENPIKLLKPFVNLRGNDLAIFVIWLIQAFCSGNHHALLVSAARGSGKSTLSRIIRTIVEPSDADISHLSNKKDDMLNTMSNLYLVCYDNVRNISKEQSDLMCSAITKGTATKRALYTNNDLYVQKLHNVIVVNGISVLPLEDDLAERFLVVTLKKLTSKKLRREKDFWDKFNEQLPYILGSIFETLSIAMTCFEKLPFENMPRMADAFSDMLAIALALGFSEEDFRKMYDENVKKMTSLRSETPLVAGVRDLMGSVDGRRKVESTAEKMLENIKSVCSGDPNDLPGSASTFTRQLDKEHDALKSAGFRANIDDTFASGTRVQIIRLKK